MRIPQAVLEVLDRADVEGPALRLTGQLDRKLYEATNKALELAGGKWSRSAKAHLFAVDAAEAIEPILLTGEITDAKREFQAFYTPADLAAYVAGQARIEPGMTLLEPSAGEGVLASAADRHGARVSCIELNPVSSAKLAALGFNDVVCGDFLQHAPPTALFDRVLMNPPFAKQADARHVLHAATFLKPAGRLVAIMAASVKFRDTLPYAAVRDLVQRHGGAIEDLPEGSFRQSGTDVNTVLVSFDA